MTSEPERLLTEGELAELWSVTPECLQKMRHEGRGPRFVRIGRLVRYRMLDVIRYLEENSVDLNSPSTSNPAVMNWGR